MQFPNLFISKCLICSIALLAVSCKKLIEIPPPKTTIGTQQVFMDEIQAEGAMAGLYTRMINATDAAGQTAIGFKNWSSGYITIVTGQSSDEFFPYRGSSDPTYFLLATNKLTILQDVITSPLWETAYNTIYNANSIIEGIAASESSSLPANTRSELMAEAKFVRAFAYFYLTNVFGDVPLALTIDFHKTVQLKRAPQEQVYKQIIDDLKDAVANLPTGYERGKGERIRPNKWAATALLARACLYTKDYPAAAAAAAAVINQPVYSLETDLNRVFQATSKEAIWQLKQATTTSIRGATPEGYSLIPPQMYKGTANFCLTDQLLQAFGPGDKRRTDWVDSTDNSVLNPLPPFTLTYYPAKYKIGAGNGTAGLPAEYYMALRLAEMYLIRAEATAYGALGGLTDAVNDVNEIRNRAGLSDLDTSLTQQQVLAAIEHERQLEFFSEWGHRWFDLKRTGRAHDVLNAIPMKLPWEGDHQFLYPVPTRERRDNPQLTQNDGY